ncbi:helix-turn-helix transcriptional regulator [Tellurirhabdus bombi]|uniref:helix-turn-helix transcriptional regulator n=1 Tax=Tellurirhabdus bombi TaxID=2907205 RepID=UPI001F20D17B|nr:YafY family protein [Tellurirhabdus bombi]
MNRIDRVTAILIQLQSRKIVKAQTMADRFGVSLRTIYRDIRTLEEAGVPIIGEAGVGYSLVDGYRLPPVMFTTEEATAFLTAEKLVEKMTDSTMNTSYKSAMYKVRAVLRSAEKELLEGMEEHIEVVQKQPPLESVLLDNTLQAILKSVTEQKVLELRYHAFHSSQTTERLVEPVGIFYAGGHWHLLAFCQLRADYRDFRTDRILELRQTDKNFNREHPSLKTYLAQVAEQQNLETIVINVDKDTVRYLQEVRYYYGFVAEKPVEGALQMTFLSPDPAVFVRWFAMFADAAEIVHPSSLRTLLKAHLTKIAERMG